MHPLRFVFRPIKDVTDAIFMPFKALFVVGLCGVINWMTFHGHWWVKWVAFGMGIAVILAFARAARALALLALIAWVGWKVYQRYGEQARARFDDWVRRTRPQAAQVMDVFHAPRAHGDIIDGPRTA